ncbi:MAG TPA: S9 family peptidase [Dysgonamonadaceae bacterium]|nr:S9 family peptidase [Dysgonamonadaceae bacterium]
MFQRFKLLLALLIVANGLFAQSKVTLQNVRAFEPIVLHKPILLDSVNLKDVKFSEELLLESAISIPKHDRFTKELKADTAGFFHLQKTDSEYAFHLLSFFLSGDSYGKAKLTVTSPNLLEVYVNGEKKASKKNATDSISNAGSAEASLNGTLNNSRVVVKLLTSNRNDFDAGALKIEVKPSEEDSLLTISFSDDPSRRIGIKDILEGKRVSSSTISPDGRFVLLKLSETLSGGDTKRYVELFDTKQNRTLIHETDNRTQLKWMPKSNKLFYVADTENGRSMITLDPLTMEESVIAEDLPKENFNIAPDEKSMFYSTKEVLSVSSPSGLKRLLAPDDRQPTYRDKYFIYQYFFDSGLSQQITFGRETASLNDISSDAKHLLFSTFTEDLSERPFRKGSMYKLNLETMEIDTLWENKTFVSYAQFSPDNQQILISGSPEAFDKIGQNVNVGQIANSYDTQAYIMDLKTKRIDPITKDFYPSIDSQQWSRVDNQIYFRVQDRDRENVYRYNPKSRKYTKLNLNEDVIRAFDLANNAEWASYTGVSASNSNRSYVVNLKNDKSELISDPYNERLSKITLGEVNDWNFRSSSGDEIEGRYYLPPNFDPNKKYPLIVYYYGGTSPTQRIFESTYPLHVYAAQDYVVYTLQPSGTTGYGQEFSARHVNAWGIETADEIIEGTKAFVAEHSFVDGSHIGCIGASYGGFMTQYLQTQTDIFAAAVSHAGISNITSYWGEGYWGYTYSAGASAGSYPWNNQEMYINQSPLFHADKINTPLLLLHGTVDTNVPMGESIQMYTALKLLGKEVEFIQVEGENHGIYDYDKRIAWNHAIYAWFAKWLKEDSRWWDSMYPSK